MLEFAHLQTRSFFPILPSCGEEVPKSQRIIKSSELTTSSDQLNLFLEGVGSEGKV